MKTIADLEKIKSEIRKIDGILLGLDMEERWGDKSEKTVQKRNKAIEKYESQSQKLEKKLLNEVKRLRKENSSLLQAWARAHVELLEDFIERHEKEHERYQTELSVARREIESWTQFAQGTIENVPQNTFYVQYDQNKFKKIFGEEIK